MRVTWIWASSPDDEPDRPARRPDVPRSGRTTTGSTHHPDPRATEQKEHRHV